MIRSLCIAAVTGLACPAFAQIQELPEGLYQREVDGDLISTVRAALPESRAVDAAFLDPAYNPVVSLSERATVTVTFIDEGAGYRNSLAWVSMPAGTLDSLSKGDIDANANSNISLTELAAVPGVEYGLVFPNASRDGSGGLLNAGDAVEIGGGREFPANTEIVFCLLQNAWRNGEVRGFSTNLETTLSFYGADMLNPESPAGSGVVMDSELHRSRHTAMLFADASFEEIILGFEDLHRNVNSDEDFNDAVFIVSSSPVEAISGTLIPGADPAFNPRPDAIFPNPDCCGIDTTDIIETELPERTNVRAEFMDPSYIPTVRVGQDTLLVLSFVGEGAIYQNSLGYITYPTGALDGVTRETADRDDDGIVEPWELTRIDGVEIGMVFAHASVAGGGGAIQPTEAVVVGDRLFPAGSSVDFFLVQDGWNDNRTVKDFTYDTGEDTLSFYSIDRFNPEDDADAQRHVAMMFANDSFESILFGFEDLHRTDRSLNPVGYESDEDFNDNVFCVSAVTADALADTNIPVAGDACLADVNQDGFLNAADFSAWLVAFQNGDPGADQNQDGVVTPADFSAWLTNFFIGCGSG